mmetsp:Transcript_16307/g.37730  ORF Transcript_16307/g.37730 Transcript_16307/m.37730 type:complete len:731 (+) Transcript_16307:164-2356(+)
MGTIEAAKRKDGKDVAVVSAKKSKTKRQRRKDLQKNSDKNKWLIQHPKIQSMDRREQMYIKDAGLNQTKAEKRQTPIDPKLDLMSPEVKFGRILAGTDQRKRHAAVKKLKAYLKARCDITEIVDSENNASEKNRNGISELDLLKLWKALWFTLYMADKKPVQDELSKHICKLLWCVVGTEEEDECAGRVYLQMTEAEEKELEEQEQNDGDDDDDDDDDDEYNVTLEEIENTLEDGSKGDDVDDDDDDGKDSEESDNEIEDEDRKEARTESTDDSEIYHCRGAHLVSLFVRTFFRTIRRDWGSMDKYRIDKFYTLIRFMMHEIYEYLSVRSWNYGIVLLLNDAIFAEILKQPPNGLRYHLIDLCLEELAKVSAKAKTPLTEEKFLDVLEPFFALSQTGRDDDTIQERVMEKVIDNFLENYCVVSEKALQEDENDDEDDKKTDKSTSVIFKDVHVRSIAEFLFTLGSDPDTKDKYRKSLYESHKKFIRRLKKIGKDVVITEDEDGNEIYDDDSDGNVDVDDVNLNNIDKSIEFLEAETNDVIPSDPNDDLGHEDIDRNDDENAMDDKPAEEVKKEPKKKKKKKRKSIEQNDHKESDDIQNISDDAVKEKKKKKSKTKEVAADEEVVITLTEQQHAKKRDRMAKKKVMEQKEEEKESADKDTDKSGEKHVSFGKKNRAKSHKASMKALKTAEPPSTKETVPEKGILRKNPKHKSTTSTSFLSKKRRKKAASYF